MTSHVRFILVATLIGIVSIANPCSAMHSNSDGQEVSSDSATQIYSSSDHGFGHQEVAEQVNQIGDEAVKRATLQIQDASRIAEQHRYKEAFKLGREALNVIRASKHLDSREYAISLMLQANLELNMYRYREASQMLFAALSASRNIDSLRGASIAIANDLAFAISRQGDHETALRILERLFEEFENSDQFATSLDRAAFEINRASVALCLKDAKVARKSIENALRYYHNDIVPNNQLWAAIRFVDGKTQIFRRPLE